MLAFSKNGWFTAVNSKGKRGTVPATLLKQLAAVEEADSGGDEEEEDDDEDVDVTVTEDSEEDSDDDDEPVSTRSKTPRS